RQHTPRDQIRALQIGFDRLPPTVAVHDRNGSNLTEAARAIDHHVKGNKPSRQLVGKLANLMLIRYIAGKGLYLRQCIGDGFKPVCSARAYYDTMTVMRERAGQPRADPGAGSTDQDSERRAALTCYRQSTIGQPRFPRYLPLPSNIPLHHKPQDRP